MTATDAPLYTRVPKDLKDRIGEYRTATSARSEAAAVAALLEAGLNAVGLPERVAELSGEVASLKQHLADESAARLKAEQQHQLLNQTVGRWNARAKQKIAKCPKCDREVTGDDLLVTGICPDPMCGYSLSIMLAPAVQNDQQPQRDNLLMLLATAGLVLGAVAISTRAS
jgi:hypothetical protein